MEKPVHDMPNLFKQLGLDNGEDDITRFVEQHKPIAVGKSLADADFWSEGQSAFITEEINEDADWAPIIGKLDAMLRD